MDIKNAIDYIAKVLEPFATIIYFIGVALAFWAFLRKRLSTKDAKIRELENTNDHLRGENSKAQNSIKKLENELNRLASVALVKANQQVLDGNEENANSHLMEWLDLEAPLIAEVCHRLACWQISAAQDEQHGRAAVLLAERLITIACALQPEKRQLRNLQYELLISKHNQDPAATADDLMRFLTDEYDNLDPAILNKYAQKYYEAGKYHSEEAEALAMATAALGDDAGESEAQPHDVPKQACGIVY